MISYSYAIKCEERKLVMSTYPDGIKGTSLEATGSLYGVTMHGITDPCDDLARTADCPN